MNLQLYNIRAKIKPCCNWDGDPVEFSVSTVPSQTVSTAGASYAFVDDVGTLIVDDTEGFPSSGQLYLSADGQAPFTLSYSGKTETSFTGVDSLPDGVSNLNPYTVSLVVSEATPKMLSVINNEEPSADFGTSRSLCLLDAAAPWQEGFTEENPSAYGCNGAKSECPYYTGPKFTEVVDEKMDTGDRITAKQVLELRFHSTKWSGFASPREEYERRFSNPDIWAWVMQDAPESNQNLPGQGRFNEFSQPMVQKVSITNLAADTPEFTVGSPVNPTTGTPTQGEPPNFPDLIKELNGATTGLEIIYPKDSTAADPYVKKAFTPAEMAMWVAVQTNSDNVPFAINVTKHPQDDLSDIEFVTKIRQEFPEDVIDGIQSGMPGWTLPVPLVLEGNRNTINTIKVFLQAGAAGDDMITASTHVRHIFYHAEVAQTSFRDRYGHPQFDPWIDRFTDLRIEAKFMHLTNNTKVHDVLWNTTTTEGKKTIYAIEETKTETSEGELIDWEVLLCRSVAVTFKDPLINRVYPWSAWETDSKGIPLYVKVDRSGNDLLPEGEDTEIELELRFVSTKGLATPANVAIFAIPDDVVAAPLDEDKDILEVRYAYTDYKHGPVTDGDLNKLKFPQDAPNIMSQFAYDVTHNDSGMSVAGTFVKPGGGRISSCEQVIGDCYTELAAENEGLAQTAFFGGGTQDDQIKTVTEMHNECRDQFENDYGGTTFEDGTEVTFDEVVKRLGELHTQEGGQHYDVIFKDEAGRPIGKKRVGFLTQSAHAQSRDVEIKYKWAAHMQHYPTRPQMLVHATFWKPTFATRERLIKVLYEYDPFCGDHTETNIGLTLFTAFDLDIDKHGALWYPYKQCQKPIYHVTPQEWFGPASYNNTVEGFDSYKRRNYWERMRFFDQYTPSTMNLWGQIGCFFSEYTTTANAHKPVVFTGYTKIRSDHAFGSFATDRESLRVSRHWEKRQLEATEETITQEDGGLTVELSDEYKDILYDSDGNLKEGTATATPLWVHMGDDFSVVNVASESMNHPFSRYLMDRVGSYVFNEVFTYDRVGMDVAFEERDHTSNVVRYTNGELVHVPEEAGANNESGELENKAGREVKWVFSDKENAWGWLPAPPQPERASATGARITGLHLLNVEKSFLKKNRRSATHPEEGKHNISYSAHKFTTSGTIGEAAYLTMDGGPKWYISQTDGGIYMIEDSPYNADLHAGEDYAFSLHGRGPDGIGLLADNRGLQYFETAGVKRATYAGVNINLDFDLNELPHEEVEIREVERLWSDPDIGLQEKVEQFTRRYTPDENGVKNLSLDFHGHYYVTEVRIKFSIGIDEDIPAMVLSGYVKEDGVAHRNGTETTPATPSYETLVTRDYARGDTLATTGSAFSTKVLLPIHTRLFTLDIELGALLPEQEMNIEQIEIFLRDHEDRTEEVYLYEPRVQLSVAETGTHKPSDLEFYFQRTNPDFSKNYHSGWIALADLGQPSGYSATNIPKTEAKWTGRQVKDLIPMFNFTGFSAIFPYENIDISKIPGYTEGTSPAAQTLRYISGQVRTSGKGWTLATTDHQPDPGASLVPVAGDDVDAADVDLFAPNVSVETLPNEDLQEYIYDQARDQLDGSTAVFKSFWHPSEKEFFLDNVGINLDDFSWELTMHSTAAPVDRVYRDKNYGCYLQATNEDTDGRVHRIANWQARGAFHYLCDARWSWACLAVVMNKCNTFLFEDYGTSAYLDNNVVDRFTYKFQFPPKDAMSYIAAGLFNQNEQGGFIGGTGGLGVAQMGQPYPTFNQVAEYYHSELYITGENKYQ
jgi:hypothetical protein